MHRYLASAALTLVLALPSSAWAQHDSNQADADESFLTDVQVGINVVQEKFGEYVVGPLASILLFDIVFWDSSFTIPLADVRLWDFRSNLVHERCLEAGLSELQCVEMTGDLTAMVRGRCEAAGASRTVCADIAGSVNVEPACLDAGLPSATCQQLSLSLPQTVRFGRCVDTGLHESACLGLIASNGAEFQARCHAAGATETECAHIVSGTDAALAYCVDAGVAGPTCRGIGTDIQVPLVVVWLILGALFFTFRFRFVNIRAFRHAIAVTRGKYDVEGDPGEVSHFQALSSALSATVGLGNIAGVAVAVGIGGPGAVFWMIVAGFLGMASKFTECTLGQLYRQVDKDGRVLGGPMRYLSKGLEEQGRGRLGKALAVLFALMCIGGSLGGGNMFQANQSYQQVAGQLEFLQGATGSVVYGMLLALLVGIVIIGGIRRIGAVAGYIVPIMCGIYLAAGLFVLVINASDIPAAFGSIVDEAFSPRAGLGGLFGVLATGFRRAAFSNEAGIGSASIAHSAAATKEPVREGIVALLEPFIDTIIVCTMTGLVIVVTGVYDVPAGQSAPEGVTMTSQAFASAISWFPSVLSIAVFLFAFSTMISWSYYGERCWSFLFGERTAMAYRFLFVFCVLLGSILNLGSVIDFSDLMILGMAFPNILGLFLLSGRVNQALDDYWTRYKAGRMLPVQPS